MYEPICFLLMGDFIRAFSPLIAIGVAVACLMIIGILSVVYMIAQRVIIWYDGIIRDDAVHYIRNHLRKLGKWYPDGTPLEKFVDEKLRIDRVASHAISYYSLEILQELLRHLLAFGQPESSLVLALAERNSKNASEVLWMRFYWKKEWWILWPESKSESPHKKAIDFRAFPESWLDDETCPEVGRIIAVRTIPLGIIRNYFR